jgi:hypothetical protein
VSVGRFACRTAVALLFLSCVFPARSFDYSRYRAIDLDELMDWPRPKDGIDIFNSQYYKITGVLTGYGEPCSTGLLKNAMVTGGIAKASVDAVAITRCIKVRTAKERVFSLYIQDAVSGFLPKEVPLGSLVTLYVIRIFAGPDGQGVVVNEFTADKRAGETGQGSQAAGASRNSDTETRQDPAGSNTALAISAGEWRRAGAGFVCITPGKRLPKPPDPDAPAKACLHMGPLGIGDPVQSLTSMLGAAHRTLPQPNEASALIYFLAQQWGSTICTSGKQRADVNRRYLCPFEAACFENSTEHRQRRPVALQHRRSLLAAHPSRRHGRINAAEVRREAHVAVVEIG